jgi:hypothetical protein
VLDCPDHNAPNKEVILWCDSDGFEVLVGGSQLDISIRFMSQVKEFDGELTI